MEKLTCIINGLPLVIEIMSMLIHMTVPITCKELWFFELEVHKLTARIGDQFVLRALKKAHKNAQLVNKIIEQAFLDHPVPLRNKGWCTVSVLLMGEQRPFYGLLISVKTIAKSAAQREKREAGARAVSTRFFKL